MVEIDPRDDDALTRYVLSWYSHFLTETENTALAALNINSKSLKLESALVKQKLGDLPERIKSPEVTKLLGKGSEECRRAIRDRLLRDHRSEIILVTCPECKRLARTPKAQMCFHCGFSWRKLPRPTSPHRGDGH
jgi:hypothetical protein